MTAIVGLKTYGQRRKAPSPWPALVIGCLIAAAISFAGSEPAAWRPKIKIVLVGDSTVTEKAGWGLGFKAYVTGDAECINTAAGGRSTQSFLGEGRWTNALALHGDYYLIQFGHNNEPGKPGRSTDMATFVSDMERYVTEARAIGAKPILVTPLTRRQWDKAEAGKIKSSLTPYAEAVRKIALDKQVPLLDLHARSIELCEQLGKDGCNSLSSLKEVDGPNTVDNTHLNAEGSFRFATLVIAEIRKSVPELAPYLQNQPNFAAVDAAKFAVPEKSPETEILLKKPANHAAANSSPR